MSRIEVIFSPVGLNHPVFLTNNTGSQLIGHVTINNYIENLYNYCLKHKINNIMFYNNNYSVELAKEFKKNYPDINVEVIEDV